MLRHKTSAPVRCSETPNMIECASYSSNNCKWGKYTKQAPYSLMVGVTSKHTYAIQCPGWGPDDGSDACEELGCYGNFFMFTISNLHIG